MITYEWKSYDGTSSKHALMANGKLIGMAIRVPWGWIACDKEAVDGLYDSELGAKTAVELLVGALDSQAKEVLRKALEK